MSSERLSYPSGSPSFHATRVSSTRAAISVVPTVRPRLPLGSQAPSLSSDGLHGHDGNDAAPGRLPPEQLATEMALRRAALALIAERGYAATSTDDIARNVGIAPNAFYEHFATKESVVLLPEGLLSDLLVAALEGRPVREDPIASLIGASVETIGTLGRLVDCRDPYLRLGVRVMLTEPSLRRVMLERRAAAEEALWATLQQRGAAADDLELHLAVSTLVAAGFLAVERWAHADGTEPLVSVFCRCLALVPHPDRLSAHSDLTG